MDPSTQKFLDSLYSPDGVSPPREVVEALSKLEPKHSANLVKVLKEAQSGFYEGCTDVERRVLSRDFLEGLLDRPDLFQALLAEQGPSLKERPLADKFEPATEQDEYPGVPSEERQVIEARARMEDVQARCDILARREWGPRQRLIAGWLQEECAKALHRLSMVIGEKDPTDPVEPLKDTERLFHHTRGTPNVSAVRRAIQKQCGVAVSNKTIALFFHRLASAIEENGYTQHRSKIIDRMHRALEGLNREAS